MDPGNRKKTVETKTENISSEKAEYRTAAERDAAAAFSRHNIDQDFGQSEEEIRAIAAAYAKFLKTKNLSPEDAAVISDHAAENEDSQKSEKNSSGKKSKKSKAQNNKAVYRPGRAAGIMSRPVDLFDVIQEKIYLTFSAMWRSLIVGMHKMADSYRHSRRIIGTAIVIIGVLAAGMLILFDRFTVYEYSYNGKVLGYVSNQDEVTDVLSIAGERLTENNENGAEIRFTANQNVTFNLVDRSGKSTDDSDTAVNKLIYMTDIETEAFGVFDGEKITAVVKSREDADSLLQETMNELSRPDDGMELVSAKFTNELSIEPVNVLLTSVQSNEDAGRMMTEGGELRIDHIVEENETLASVAAKFGVDKMDIYDEEDNELVTEVEQGDKVCIRTEVEPVSIRMVESGRMKETIEYETIKKDSADYYKGDTYTQQEGVDGVQIFEGTLTKVGGEITKRKTDNIEVIRKKQDKIILIGTKERPKTAPTGTYAMPIYNYTLTSNFGYRWGRLHSGIDMGAPTGTPIYASDGGTVVRAGWYAGYGLCVDIDHENGRLTRYGHCSKLLVNVGDKVYQGQNISLVGNTGHSFGSHLHFEIRQNDTPRDPRPILGI